MDPAQLPEEVHQRELVPAVEDRPATASSGPGRGAGKLIVGALIATGLFLLKIKSILFLFLARGKLLLVNPLEGFGLAQLTMTLVSMIVSVGAYAFRMGLSFAIGFVVLTVIHELGHALVIRAKGLRAGAMVFIPFVGGAVTLKDQPHSAFDDAQIGLAGPIAGTVASLLSLWIFRASGDPLYLILAFAGFLLNLFNLMPIGPFDGGRIAAAISKWMWVLGGGILVYFLVVWRSPLLVLVLVLGAFQIYRAAVGELDGLFYSVTIAQRARIAVIYFALVSFLGFEAMTTHRMLLMLH